MKRVILVELRDGIVNIRFFVGIFFCSAFFMGVCYPYYMEMIKTGLDGNEPAWLSLFEYGIFTEAFLMAIPIFAPLAAGGLMEGELRSRFVVFRYYRSGKRFYIWGKYLSAFVSGGGMVLVTLILSLGVCVIAVDNSDQRVELSNGIYILQILGDFFRLFLHGGVWAVIGSLSSVLCKNRYMSVTVPFVLYYVLSVFQSRYYSDLPLLSPRYWASPLYYSNGSCIIILALCAFFCGCGYWFAVKRRIGHG